MLLPPEILNSTLWENLWDGLRRPFVCPVEKSRSELDIFSRKHGGCYEEIGYYNRFDGSCDNSYRV